MKTKALACVFLFAWGNALLAYPSLFFTDEEIKCIHEEGKDKKAHNLKLHLSALIYRDENHWSLWVNHKIMCSEMHGGIDGFHLERVKPHEVTFSWIPSDSLIPKTFKLRPSQTNVAKE